MAQLNVDQQTSSFKYRNCMYKNCNKMSKDQFELLKKSGHYILDKKMYIDPPHRVEKAVNKLHLIELLEKELELGCASEEYAFDHSNRICEFFDNCAEHNIKLTVLAKNIVLDLRRLDQNDSRAINPPYKSAYLKNEHLFYPINEMFPKKGYCIMFNQFSEGNSADVDSLKMKEVFQNYLEFEFIEKVNFTGSEATAFTIDICKQMDVNNIQCNSLVVILCSLDYQADPMYGGDHTQGDAITEIFSSCPALHNIPKIFFFQNCRAINHETKDANAGIVKDANVAVEGGAKLLETAAVFSKINSPSVVHDPKMAKDIVCAYATRDSKLAYRTQDGTAFLQTLAELLQNPYFGSECCLKLLEGLSKKVTETTEKLLGENKIPEIQEPKIIHNLQKKFCFKPYFK